MANTLQYTYWTENPYAEPGNTTRQIFTPDTELHVRITGELTTTGAGTGTTLASCLIRCNFLTYRSHQLYFDTPINARPEPYDIEAFVRFGDFDHPLSGLFETGGDIYTIDYWDKRNGWTNAPTYGAQGVYVNSVTLSTGSTQVIGFDVNFADWNTPDTTGTMTVSNAAMLQPSQITSGVDVTTGMDFAAGFTSLSGGWSEYVQSGYSGAYVSAVFARKGSNFIRLDEATIPDDNPVTFQTMLQNLYKRLEDLGGGYIPSSPGWTFYGGMRRVDKNVWHLATLGTLTVYPYGAPSASFFLPPTLSNSDGTLNPYGNYVTFTARGSSINLDSGENNRATLSYKLTINGTTVKEYTVYWDDVTDGNIANKYGGPLTFLIPGTHNPNDTYVLYVKLANAISAYEVSRTFQGLQSIVRFLPNGNIEFYGAVTFLGQVTLPDGTTVNPS